MNVPPDTRLEHERRWLVDPDDVPKFPLDPVFKTIRDRYLRCGRLRLRELSDTDPRRRVLKLTKKYPSGSSYTLPLVTVLLTDAEHGALCALDADELSKTRHYFDHAGRTFSLDIFGGALAGLVLCSIEADSIEALLAIEPPPHALAEVTLEAFFTGGNLCRLDPEQLREGLRRQRAGEPLPGG